MNLKNKITKGFSYQFHVTSKKIVAKLCSKANTFFSRLKDRYFSSYSSRHCYSPESLATILIMPVGQAITSNEDYSLLAKLYLNHRFDLLGSGWVKVQIGMNCRGLEGIRYNMEQCPNIDSQGKWLKGRINFSNVIESQHIWKQLESGYIPIDWHIDFKSGYRWNEETWYKDIMYGQILGVDVKVPWELSRMQHLPYLALTHQNLANCPEEQKMLKYEFRNQILDFIATNPPRFGVNWSCTMDVALRAANWLSAYDIFWSGDAKLDQPFRSLFARSIHEHGLHIIDNLEWYNQQRGNHYLANIAGLVFIAAHLPSNSEVDAWLSFAVQELITEVDYQFYPDGSNFEGSTAYHRLSAEMVYYATALILGLPDERWEKLRSYNHKLFKTGWGKPSLKPSPIQFYRVPEESKTNRKETPFPHWYFERMERMAEFVIDLTKPNGRIPQIGDNDSGRFFKLDPRYELMKVGQAKETYANLEGYNELPDDADYFIEDHLDCSHLIAAAYGLFDREDFALCLGGTGKASIMPDCVFIQALAGRATIGSQRFLQRMKENNESFTIGTKEDFQQALSDLQLKPDRHVRKSEFPSKNKDLCQNLTLRAYPNFGIYIYKSPHLYLSIRCWPGHKPFHTGHMHNDQLSIELVIDHKELITDPGTYLYTPLPKRRNEYRSARAHFTPLQNHDESSLLNTNLFMLPDPRICRIFYCGHNGFCGEMLENSKSQGVLCTISNKKIIVFHFSFSFLQFHDNLVNKQIPYSRSYGFRNRNRGNDKK